MAKWDVEVSQSFGCSQAEACEKVGQMVADFQKQNAGMVKSVKWNADRTMATAEGQGFEAEFAVTSGQVHARVKLGMLLKMLKGKVESGLRKQLDRNFG